MNSLTRAAIVLALSLGCGSLPCLAFQTTPQSKPSTKALGATVSGRVTLQGKGKGGIVVGLRVNGLGPQMGPAFKGITDPDGNYRITDVPAGNYQIVPIAPAFVISDVGSFGAPGKSLILAEGERVEGIDFSIIRGAVITGKVTQWDGRPAIEERVYLVNADQANQRDMRFGGMSGQTDDRGIYRIFGTAPGRYKVFIGEPENSFSPIRTRPIFQRVFYPSVSEIEEAKVVEVAEGAEVSNIDITVGPPVQSFAANGVIVDGETNQPVPNIRFGLQKILDGNTSFMGVTSLSNSRGEFRIENIPPGKYALYAMPQQNSDVRVDPLRIEVVDQDVKGLLLRTAKGASVSGVVVIDGPHDKDVYAKLSKLRLFGYVRPASGFEGSGFGSVSTIESDGGFRFGGLQPGSMMFQLSSSDPSAQSAFVISRIERDGVAQPRSAVEIKLAEQISGLRIVVTYGSGIVRGSVKWANGEPPSGGRLMVTLTKPGDSSYAVRPQEVDARGRFVFPGVPAGTYNVNLNVFNPAARGRQTSVKQPVTVTDGAVSEVELVVETTAPVSPTP